MGSKLPPVMLTIKKIFMSFSIDGDSCLVWFYLFILENQYLLEHFADIILQQLINLKFVHRLQLQHDVLTVILRNLNKF